MDPHAPDLSHFDAAGLVNTLSILDHAVMTAARKAAFGVEIGARSICLPSPSLLGTVRAAMLAHPAAQFEVVVPIELVVQHVLTFVGRSRPFVGRAGLKAIGALDRGCRSVRLGCMGLVHGCDQPGAMMDDAVQATIDPLPKEGDPWLT